MQDVEDLLTYEELNIEQEDEAEELFNVEELHDVVEKCNKIVNPRS